jgi:predicted O-methyltransferase YrrM
MSGLACQQERSPEFNDSPKVRQPMDDTTNLNPRPILEDLIRATQKIGFKLASDPLTGSLLRTLAASKPAGRFLEIGTGTGIGTAWLLAGMDQKSSLVSVENDKRFIEIARIYLGSDPRVSFHLEDAGELIARLPKASFDLIFADTWAAKPTDVDERLALLKPGGLYILDDMLPKPTWKPDYPLLFERLIADLESRSDLVLTKMNWGTGIIVATRR